MGNPSTNSKTTKPDCQAWPEAPCAQAAQSRYGSIGRNRLRKVPLFAAVTSITIKNPTLWPARRNSPKNDAGMMRAYLSGGLAKIGALANLIDGTPALTVRLLPSLPTALARPS